MYEDLTQEEIAEHLKAKRELRRFLRGKLPHSMMNLTLITSPSQIVELPGYPPESLAYFATHGVDDIWFQLQISSDGSDIPVGGTKHWGTLWRIEKVVDHAYLRLLANEAKKRNAKRMIGL